MSYTSFPAAPRRHTVSSISQVTTTIVDTEEANGTMRIDSAADCPPPDRNFTKWQYFARNSSLSRKRNLERLQGRYAHFKAEPIVEGGLYGGMQSLQSAHPCASMETLQSTHPFKGLSKVERRGEWEGLRAYSGTSLPYIPGTPVGNGGGVSMGTPNAAGDDSYDQQQERQRSTLRDTPVASSDIVVQRGRDGSGRKKGFRDLIWRGKEVMPREEERISRLPRMVGTSTLPARFKMKTGWGKKRVIDFDIQPKLEHFSPNSGKVAQRGVGEASAAQRERNKESKLLKLANHTKPRSIPAKPNPVSHPSPTTNHPGNTRRTQSRKSIPPPNSVIHQALNALSNSQLATPPTSLAQRLQRISLADLPLREGGAERITHLLRDIERDTREMYDTWPPRGGAAQERKLRNTFGGAGGREGEGIWKGVERRSVTTGRSGANASTGGSRGAAGGRDSLGNVGGVEEMARPGGSSIID
jgi:hypothetical protein